MYQALLILHSYLRWLVLGLTVLVVIRSFVAGRRGRDWLPVDERTYAALIQAFDVQVLLGLLLYLVFSPWPRVLWADFGAGVKHAQVRFFGMEHVTLMLLVVAVLHVTRLRSKRLSPGLRHKRVFRGTLLALMMLLAAIPWPGLEHGRPLFRGDFMRRAGSMPSGASRSVAPSVNSVSFRRSPLEACDPLQACYLSVMRGSAQHMKKGGQHGHGRPTDCSKRSCRPYDFARGNGVRRDFRDGRKEHRFASGAE